MKKIDSGKKLLALVKEYLAASRDSAAKRPHFPNVAGFCDYAGISVEDFTEMGRRYPIEYASARASFEDAALNSGTTAAIIGMYIKQNGFWHAPRDNSFECEHDAYADGI